MSLDETYVNGLRVGRWALQPWPVAGGWQVRWSRWVEQPRDAGWLMDDEPCQQDRAIYATKERAQAAIALIAASERIP